MRLLLDECVPKRLKGELAGHQVLTVREAGWAGLKNGALLRAASGRFDVLVTVDQGIEYQHGVPWLLDRYAGIIRSVETQTCDHGCGQNAGDGWRMCCGISYEYMNDLAVRDALEIIIHAAGASRAERLATEVARLDDRLYSLYKHHPDRRGDWWRQGLPQGVIDDCPTGQPSNSRMEPTRGRS